MPRVVANLVSTIIPVYNRSSMVGKAIASVLGQSYRPIEIIVVNDGSTDETPLVLDGFARRYPTEIRVIHKTNGGAGLAREAGRQVARGEFIQYLDSDDWLLPNKFTDQVTALRAHPECGIAYGVTRLVDAKGNILREPSKQTGVRHDYLFPALLMDRWWHTSTPLYRRAVSDAAGPWPERRPEDWDLEARMGAARVRLVHCGTVVSCHCDHPSAQRVSRGDQAAYLRDEAWFLPRLYRCALEAGVSHDSPEMKHFSRWAFMRARYLGALGEPKLAWAMIELAMQADPARHVKRGLVRSIARAIGWRATGALCAAWDSHKAAFRAWGAAVRDKEN